MSEPSNVLRGILHPDGTLELAGRPTLPAGDVEVTIRPVAGEAPKETLRESMQRGRARLEASGRGSRPKAEIDADIEDMRDWGEDRLEEAEPTAEGYGPYLARIRARREAEGFPFRSKAEIDAEIEDLRSWGEGPEGAPREGEGREARQ